jgi:nitroreductase
MDAIECIMSRMSIRRFKADPVPKDVLKKVIETALRSPSYKNTQPWEAIVVSGSKKEELSRLLVGIFEKGSKPAPDIPEPSTWPPHIEARIKELIRGRKENLGIDLTDPEVGRKSKIANFNFYGAPHGIFLFQDSALSLWSIFDMGLFAQSLMLSAHAEGFGTVPQAFLTDYAAEVKKFLGIPAEKRLVLGMSMGYPDTESKINRFRTDRAGVDEIVRWVE